MVEELSTSPSYLIKKWDRQHPLAHRPVHVRPGDFASKRHIFRHLAVESALERGSRWGIETLALAPFSIQFFYASLLVRTSSSLGSAWRA